LKFGPKYLQLTTNLILAQQPPGQVLWIEKGESQAHADRRQDRNRPSSRSLDSMLESTIGRYSNGTLNSLSKPWWDRSE
jgi:hypothetical protein